MLTLQLVIENPWSRRFRNLYNRAGHLRGNLCWEVQFMQTADILSLKFEWTMARDHAGPYCELGLFGYSISASIYDRRHWDHFNNRWEND